MKLIAVWNARDAIARLSVLKKPPKLAGQLLRYWQKYNAEYAICDAQRTALVYQAAGVEGGQVTLQVDTPAYVTFVETFNAFLDTEAELSVSGISLDTLLDALDAEKGNALSENDLFLIEPFFHSLQ